MRSRSARGERLSISSGRFPADSKVDKLKLLFSIRQEGVEEILNMMNQNPDIPPPEEPPASPTSVVWTGSFGIGLGIVATVLAWVSSDFVGVAAVVSIIALLVGGTAVSLRPAWPVSWLLAARYRRGCGLWLFGPGLGLLPPDCIRPGGRLCLRCSARLFTIQSPRRTGRRIRGLPLLRDLDGRRPASVHPRNHHLDLVPFLQAVPDVHLHEQRLSVLLPRSRPRERVVGLYPV